MRRRENCIKIGLFFLEYMTVTGFCRNWNLRKNSEANIFWRISLLNRIEKLFRSISQTEVTVRFACCFQHCPSFLCFTRSAPTYAAKMTQHNLRWRIKGFKAYRVTTETRHQILSQSQAVDENKLENTSTHNECANYLVVISSHHCLLSSMRPLVVSIHHRVPRTATETWWFRYEIT